LNSACRDMTDSDTEMGTETDLHAERYSRAGRTHRHSKQRLASTETQTDIDNQ